MTQNTKPYSSQCQALQQLKVRTFKATATHRYSGTDMVTTSRKHSGLQHIIYIEIIRPKSRNIQISYSLFYCFTFSHSEDISD